MEALGTSNAARQKPRHLARQLVPLPLPPPSPQAAAAIKEAECVLSSMPPWGELVRELRGRLRAGVAGFDGLRHALSTHMNPSGTDTAFALEAEGREVERYQSWLRESAGRLSIGELVRLNEIAIGSPSALRASRGFLRAQDGSSSIDMVPWQQAIHRLFELPRHWDSETVGSGVLAGARLLLLVNNAHAFVDGNGRLGRFLFNYCLHCAGMPIAAYIPLKTFSAVALGGYEIRLREAEIFGRYDPLIQYLSGTVQLTSTFAAGHTTTKTRESASNVL